MAKGKYEQWLEPESLLLLESWARDGLTDEQIAHNIGVRRETLYDWIKKYPNISNALKKGKEVVDIQVENALLKRALGYTWNEITRGMQENPLTGENELVITRTVTRDVPPDTTALIFWLKNRRPDLWREKQSVEVQGSISQPNAYDALTVEELKTLARKCEADGNT